MQLPFTTVKEIWDLEARYLETQSATDESLEEAVIGFKENVRSRETHETPNGYLLKAELSSMVLWIDDGLPRYIDRNPPGVIEYLTGEVFSLDDDWEKLSKLTALRGVRESVASVVLHLYDPKKYPILDACALRAIGIKRKYGDYDAEFWQKYTNFFRVAAESYDVSMRTLDRALQMIDWIVENTIPMTKQTERSLLRQISRRNAKYWRENPEYRRKQRDRKQRNKKQSFNTDTLKIPGL